MAARKITERRAAEAARQLLYHERLTEWISRKKEENQAILEHYLLDSGEEKTVTLGGYVLERKVQPGEDREESPVEVSELASGPDYEQLELLTSDIMSEVT